MSKKWVLVFSLVVVTVGYLIFASHTRVEAQEPARKGQFTLVEGNVRKKQIVDEDWIRAQEQGNVLSGDRVRTLLESRAEMKLAELDVIRLAPRTTIDIVKLYEETKEKKIQTHIKVSSGDVWGKVKSVDANSQFEVTSDFAGAAITGTIFRIKQDSSKQETQVKVYTGEVKIKKMSGPPQKPQQVGKPQEVPGPQQVPGPQEVSAEQWIQIVRSMQQVTIGPGGLIKSVGNFSTNDADENTAWVRWNQERDRALQQGTPQPPDDEDNGEEEEEQ
ncbi:MAG: FecR domain-containing protein [Calditrichaeota bacterium]|nr:FecR domain-containing protein [Calditrichota bacterium]MCB0302217.1 FecR domain-containing protein [Calditrichota bacterium]